MVLILLILITHQKIISQLYYNLYVLYIDM
ncbi:hypothetical protein BRC2024_PQPTKSFJ_CDS_0251 [Tegunavirus sp. BRC001]